MKLSVLDTLEGLPMKRNTWVWMECGQHILQKSQPVCGAVFIDEGMKCPLPGPPLASITMWQWDLSLDDHQNNLGSLLKIQVPEPSPRVV